MTQVAQGVREVLAHVLNRTPDEIDLGMRIIELPGMDSLHLVEAVTVAEARWGVKFDEDDLFDVRTGHDLCALIQQTAEDPS
ncbi:acyl carrier protein [Streptomyces sp. TRM76323]|uniref:Acyl carrier protein n=1 Tax=Streptomyces tamarix TaxID=3078565 RepID=A0ABU3QE69_9ACTN|nr:acyl carrier protein [Streptomyces tamarix]MDT9681060.1 acyl carrier protein [Streptomyces tamarix]